MVSCMCFCYRMFGNCCDAGIVAYSLSCGGALVILCHPNYLKILIQCLKKPKKCTLKYMNKNAWIGITPVSLNVCGLLFALFFLLCVSHFGWLRSCSTCFKSNRVNAGLAFLVNFSSFISSLRRVFFVPFLSRLGDLNCVKYY